MHRIQRWIQGVLRPLAYPMAAALLLALSACGGGGSATSSPVAAGFPASAATQLDPNVAVIAVKQGPASNVNIPYVSVTVCLPGTTSCKTIDNILLDTGSTGLRLFASNLNAAPALALPPHQVGSNTAIYECAQFLDSKAWGAIKRADIVIGAKRALNVPVQVVDTNYPSGLNSTCGHAALMAPPSSGQSGQSVLSANGILGTGLFTNDGQSYFNCTGASPCQSCSTLNPCDISLPASQQVQNPVSLFATDNNGVIVQLPALPATGVSSASGYLIFGIGTATNNGLGSAYVVPVNSMGRFTTRYNSLDRTDSFIDSGSNGLFFDDPSLQGTCTSGTVGFFCPAATQTRSAGIWLENNVVAVLNFSIANSDSLFQGGRYAFNNLGGSLSAGTFDWGLPFFFGRSVYTAIEGKPVGNRVGPFYAFTN